ncbi:helix-turn-helix domain-containing protein [Terriglobus sp. 2YAB30_2]|uniref:helix-turn-helix domain-containing protein n=1 Tax=unclassified Terriglobus TaxID=2628988 RepID=UPI003F9616F2
MSVLEASKLIDCQSSMEMLEFRAVQTEPTAIAEMREDERLLDQVLQSRTFVRSITLKKLLLYLWENRDHELNEYAIATDALGRRPDFDSKIDATVRVQIGRLRKSLEKFYAEEGADHSRRIAIPVGSHQLLFVAADEAEPFVEAEPEGRKAFAIGEDASAPPPTIAVTPEPPSRPIIATPFAVAILLLLAVCTALLFKVVLTKRNVAGAPHRDLPLFWSRVLENGKPMRMVLPAPVFFSFPAPNGGRLIVRDILINTPSQWRESAAISQLVTSHTDPTAWQGYTVASDTFASLELARYMDGYGVRSNFSSSANTPQQIVDHENIVALGTKRSLATYQTELDQLGFQMEDYETRVVDRLSSPTNPRDFPLVSEPGSRQVTPGIVALLPHGNDGARILLVQGAQTTALITYLTSEDGLREINDALQKMNTPYFEAVIFCEVNQGAPIQARLGAIRPFNAHPIVPSKP